MGLLLLLATFNSPLVGASGLFAVIVTLGFVRLTSFDVWDGKSGVLAFNSLLVVLAFSFYTPVAWIHSHPYLYIVLLAVISIISALAYLVINWIMQTYFKLPSMSITFSIIALLMWFVMSKQGVFVQTHLTKSLLTYWNPQIPEYWQGYFRSLGSLLFSPYIISGLIIALAMLLHSRILFLLSIGGWSICYILCQNFPVTIHNTISYQGFNLILVAMAIGGIYYIPSISAFAYTLLALGLAYFLSILLPLLNPEINPPVFALPFNIVAFFFIFAFRLRLKYIHPYPNDLVILHPEKGLENYLSGLKRFSQIGIPQFNLPVNGEWLITQGTNGSITHQREWAYAWDMEIRDASGKPWLDNQENLTEYYCYNKPVHASADGYVSRILSHIPDNQIDAINTHDNWGNYVILSHGYGLYTMYAHLKPGSVTVAQGSYIRRGDKIGLVGNSGRSPIPHFHFQVQLGSEPGSKTLLSNISNYKIRTSENKYKFISYGIPQEGEVISPLLPEDKLQQILGLKCYQNHKFNVKTNKAAFAEEWAVDVDLLGNFRICSSQKNELEFSVYNGIYNSLRLNRRKKNTLFAFALLLSRFPYLEKSEISWKDTPVLSIVLNSFLRNIFLLITPLFRPITFTTESSSSETNGIIRINSSTQYHMFGIKLNHWHGNLEIEKSTGLRELKLYKNNTLFLDAKRA